MSASGAARKLGVVVVGRKFGTRAHVPALRAAGFEVVALVSRDLNKTQYRAGQLGIPHACASLEEALRIPGVDAVTIAAPPLMHCELTEEALAAGRHVICEKPFTVTVAEARRVYELAVRAGVVHMVGHEFRWNPARAAVGAAVAAGHIGTTRLFTVVNYEPLLTDPVIGTMPAWFHQEGSGGGWIGAVGCHAFDQVLAWLGPYESVSASGVIAGDRVLGPEDSFLVRARMRCGAEGVIQGSGAAWAELAFTSVSGTRGTLSIEGADHWTGATWISDAEGRRVLDHPPERDSFSRIAGAATTWQQFAHLEIWHYTRLCEAFRRAIEGAAPDPAVPLPTFADGLSSMQVIDAIRRSVAAGGAVTPVLDWRAPRADDAV